MKHCIPLNVKGPALVQCRTRASQSINLLSKRHGLAGFTKRNQPSRSANAAFLVEATTQVDQGQLLDERPAIAKDQLKDPAHIGARASTSIDLKDDGGATSLDRYMHLPIEQYFELDPTMIKPLGGNRFALAVPRVTILSVWISALVDVRVRFSEQEGIIIEATNCRIHGSDLVENMRLDQRFCLSFSTRLTWKSGQKGFPAAPAQNGNGAGPATALEPFGHAQIKGDAELDVWCEVIPPFNFMPRAVLEASGNVVMSQLVKALLPTFMGSLGKDYQRWASDAEYRKRRANSL